MAWLGDGGINELLNDARISDIELHLLLLLDLASVTCIDLGLVLLLLEKSNHLSVLLLHPLDFGQVPLDIAPHCVLFLLHFF